MARHEGFDPSKHGFGVRLMSNIYDALKIDDAFPNYATLHQGRNRTDIFIKNGAGDRIRTYMLSRRVYNPIPVPILASTAFNLERIRVIETRLLTWQANGMSTILTRF